MTTDKLEIEDKLFKAISKNLIDINKKTTNKTSNRLIIKHHITYMDIFKPFFDSTQAEIINDSLFWYRFIEFDKQFQWLYYNITSGSYHQSIRELRYILESFIQSYYIDKNHPQASMECKMEILKEVELYGFNLINKTSNLTTNNKKKLKKLYSHLSKHVHSSYEKLNPVFEYEEIEHSIIFKYNERMLFECINLLQETFDAILLLIFLYDPNLSSNINETFIETLKSNKYNMAYSTIQNQKRNILD